MVGASNSFNQIIEKDLDKFMDRTKNRPIPSGKMSVNTAFIISILCMFLNANGNLLRMLFRCFINYLYNFIVNLSYNIRSFTDTNFPNTR